MLKKCLNRNHCQSEQWCGLWNVQPAAARTLGSWVWLRLEAHMYMCILLHFCCPSYTHGHQLTDSSCKDYNCMSTHQNQKPRKWGTLGCTDLVNHRKTHITQYAMFYMQNLPQMYNFSVYYINKQPLNSSPLFLLYILCPDNFVSRGSISHIWYDVNKWWKMYMWN